MSQASTYTSAPRPAPEFNIAKFINALVLALALAGTTGGVVMYRELGEVRSTVDALARSIERIEQRLERMDAAQPRR